MNILNIEHVSKLYGDKWIFDDISCGIQEGEKIGIIGINGTGKTTLLRIIAGAEEPDQGQVVRQNGAKLAYLTQLHEFPEEETVLSYVVSGSAAVKGSWGGDQSGDADIMEHEARSMLNTLVRCMDSGKPETVDGQLQHEKLPDQREVDGILDGNKREGPRNPLGMLHKEQKQWRH